MEARGRVTDHFPGWCHVSRVAVWRVCGAPRAGPCPTSRVTLAILASTGENNDTFPASPSVVWTSAMFGLGELTATAHSWLCVPRCRVVGRCGNCGEEKMFWKHFHSLNESADKSAAAEGRAQHSSASIGDCCLTQLQREEDFICGTRTMHIVIPSVARPWKQFSLSQLVFFSCYFLKYFYYTQYPSDKELYLAN